MTAFALMMLLPGVALYQARQPPQHNPAAPKGPEFVAKMLLNIS
jgi:hypothetical protein